MAKEKKFSTRFVVIVGICILLAGYIVGSFVPVTALGSGSMAGASYSGGGGGSRGGKSN
jgi:hypothetical protein